MGKNEVWLHIHELKAHNFHFNFAWKQLICIKNSNSKYELDFTTALCALCMLG
jgi:hypothetical protein